jgi:hypothetical protein
MVVRSKAAINAKRRADHLAKMANPEYRAQLREKRRVYAREYYKALMDHPSALEAMKERAAKVSARWYAAHKDSIRARRRPYFVQHDAKPERQEKKRRAYEARIHDPLYWARWMSTGRKLLITAEDLATLAISFDGSCQSCGKLGLTFRFQAHHTRRTAAHIDHDHQTKRFRGFVCARCNQALGVLDDRQLVAHCRSFLERAKSIPR